jgi:hypothetical protein
VEQCDLMRTQEGEKGELRYHGTFIFHVCVVGGRLVMKFQQVK